MVGARQYYEETKELWRYLRPEALVFFAASCVERVIPLLDMEHVTSEGVSFTQDAAALVDSVFAGSVNSLPKFHWDQLSHSLEFTLGRYGDVDDDAGSGQSLEELQLEATATLLYATRVLQGQVMAVSDCALCTSDLFSDVDALLSPASSMYAREVRAQLECIEVLREGNPPLAVLDRLRGLNRETASLLRDAISQSDRGE